MRNILRITFILLFSLFLSFNAYAQETPEVEPREISIVFTNFVPLSYINEETGEFEGFYFEIFTRILEEYNIDYEVIYSDDFFELYNKVINNEYDIFSGLLRTPDREDLFYWPDHSIRTLYSSLYTKYELLLEEPEQLRNERVGIVRNEAAGERFLSFMEEFDIDFIPVFYSGFEEVTSALENGEIVAFTASSSIRVDEYSNNAFRSSFVFSPMSGYFTCSVDSDDYVKQVVDILSNRIHELKTNRDSYYWSLYNKYFETIKIEETPQWVLLGIPFLLLVILSSFIIIRILTRRLRLSNNELKKLNETLEKKIDIAAKEIVDMEKMASIGKLTASIAHEMNTPIGVAYTSSSLEQHKVEILEEKYNNNELSEKELLNFFEASKEAFNLLNYNLERAADLIQRLKGLSAEQTLANEIRDFEVPDFFYNIWKSVKLTYKEKDVKLHLDCDNILFKNAKPSRMYQVTLNYLLNSFEHGFAGRNSGNVYITLKVNEDNNLYWCYEDDGNGMSEEVVKKILEPFFTTKKEEGNTGLGMSIIFNILATFKARDIKIENRVGGGFKISYIIPIGDRSRKLTKQKEKYIIE